MKGIYDKATSGNIIPESIGGFDTSNITDTFADNTQPFESFSEYRNRIGNVNNISEEEKNKEIKVKPKTEEKKREK